MTLWCIVVDVGEHLRSSQGKITLILAFNWIFPSKSTTQSQLQLIVGIRIRNWSSRVCDFLDIRATCIATKQVVAQAYCSFPEEVNSFST
jgi:hypothetical protein